MRPLAIISALVAFAVGHSPAVAQEMLHACKGLHESISKAAFTVDGPRIADKPALILVGVPGAFTPETATLGVDSLWATFAGFDQWIVGMKDKLGYGVCYDGDEAGGFSYFAGAEVIGDAAPPTGFARLAVPAATYAVFTHTGLAWTIPNARLRIHKGMLPQGYVLADAPEIEFYPEDYKPGSPKATMEIWVPVVPE